MEVRHTLRGAVLIGAEDDREHSFDGHRVEACGTAAHAQEHVGNHGAVAFRMIRDGRGDGFSQGVEAFADIFSGAGGLANRTHIIALSKRSATVAEKLYATGTGTDAAPAKLVFEGAVAGDDVVQARELAA